MAKIEKIESFTGYISFVEKNCKAEDILFRGQQQDWPLIPKIGRLKHKKRLRPTEFEMLKRLIRTGHPYLTNLDPYSERGQISIDLVAFAQHNGMATRLLDWTQNPLAALWFAVRKPPAIDKNNIQQNGVVWIYSGIDGTPQAGSHSNAFPTEKIIIYRPTHVTNQITAQQGAFTIHGYKEEKNSFLPMESCDPYCHRLTKIIIPPEIFADIRFQLDRCGINEASMFPGVGGLCKHIEWFHTLLDDEVAGNLTEE